MDLSCFGLRDKDMYFPIKHDVRVGRRCLYHVREVSTYFYFVTFLNFK